MIGSSFLASRVPSTRRFARSVFSLRNSDLWAFVREFHFSVNHQLTDDLDDADGWALLWCWMWNDCVKDTIVNVVHVYSLAVRFYLYLTKLTANIELYAEYVNKKINIVTKRMLLEDPARRRKLLRTNGWNLVRVNYCMRHLMYILYYLVAQYYNLDPLLCNNKVDTNIVKLVLSVIAPFCGVWRYFRSLPSALCCISGGIMRAEAGISGPRRRAAPRRPRACVAVAVAVAAPPRSPKQHSFSTNGNITNGNNKHLHNSSWGRGETGRNKITNQENIFSFL